MNDIFKKNVDTELRTKSLTFYASTEKRIITVTIRYRIRLTISEHLLMFINNQESQTGRMEHFFLSFSLFLHSSRKLDLFYDYAIQ